MKASEGGNAMVMPIYLADIIFQIHPPFTSISNKAQYNLAVCFERGIEMQLTTRHLLFLYSKLKITQELHIVFGIMFGDVQFPPPVDNVFLDVTSFFFARCAFFGEKHPLPIQPKNHPSDLQSQF